MVKARRHGVDAGRGMTGAFGCIACPRPSHDGQRVECPIPARPTNGTTPLPLRSGVTANNCGNRSVAVVIVDNNGRTRRAAVVTLLTRTARLTRTAGAALTSATAAATGLRESDSDVTCGCAQNQRAGNETCPEYPNGAT